MATGGFLRAGILLLFLGQACLFLPCSAQDAAAARVDVVLTHLPGRETHGYSRLHITAGRPRQAPLTMTHSEVWRIPQSRLLALRAIARQHGDPSRPSGPMALSCSRRCRANPQ